MELRMSKFSDTKHAEALYQEIENLEYDIEEVERYLWAYQQELERLQLDYAMEEDVFNSGIKDEEDE